MRKRNIQLGQLEIKVLFALEESDAGVVTSKELARLAGTSARRANKIAFQLCKKKRLLRVKKGLYVYAPLKSGAKGEWMEDAYALVDKLFERKEYYAGFWMALNLYGLTEQIPRVLQVVTIKQHKPFEAFGTRVEFIKVKKLGEWRSETIGGRTFKIATLEQLLMDCLTLPQYCGRMPGASKAVWLAHDKINWDALNRVASKSNEVARQRLGYLLQTLGLDYRKVKLYTPPAGWRWLDPSSPKQMKGKSQEWKLWLNVSRKELTDWMES